MLNRVTGITAAEIQCEDPEAVAKRWSEIAQLPAVGQADRWTIALDNATLRFVTCDDGRPEGLGGIDVATADRDAVLAAAAERGAVSAPDQVYLCGLRINLI